MSLCFGFGGGDVIVEGVTSSATRLFASIHIKSVRNPIRFIGVNIIPYFLIFIFISDNMVMIITLEYGEADVFGNECFK